MKRTLWLASPGLIVIVLLAICLPRFATAQAPSDSRPLNVLVLVSDDQRPDTIAALGNDQIRTPHLDALARRSMVMRQAVCANPICTPSRAEILSGCSSFRSGVLDFGGKMRSDLVMWPEAMRRHGYQTWYVGKWHNDHRPPHHGYVGCRGLFAGGGGKWWTPQTDWRGNEVTGYRGWIFQSPDGKQKHPDRGVGLTADISAKFADAAIDVIKSRQKASPFFLHVNFTAPHDPLLIPQGKKYHYDPASIRVPKNFLAEHPFDHGNFNGRDEKLLPWPRTETMVQRTLAAYYSVITHLDEQVGRILQALEAEGLLENTLVIYTSDHGLAVGSHGLRGKQSMYEHTIGVPLLIAGPGIQSGESQAPIYLRDLYPTVCQLTNTPLPQQDIDGVSHADVLLGQAKQHHKEVFGYFRKYQRMIRRDGWKLIEYPQVNRTQLFHVAEDPHELNDLAQDASQQERRRDLKKRLDDWFNEQQKLVPASISK